MKTQIFIVDDHPIVRHALASMITRMVDFDVCAVATTAESAIEQLKHILPDLILVDVSLPAMDGIELVRTILERRPQQYCAIYSGNSEPGAVTRAFAAGARGYILKGQPSELQGALQQIMAGDFYASAALATA